MSAFRYTPRTVSTIKLHARTMAPATIATVMRCPVSTVELICRKHGIEMRAEDYVMPEISKSRAELRDTTKLVEIRVDSISFTIVACEARRRGMATRDLMAKLVDAVAEDQLFSAILEK